MRNLEAVMTKDPMCLIPIPNVTVLRKWYGAVGMCGSKLCTGVPVLQELYSVFLRYGTQSSDGFVQEVFKNRSQLNLMRGVAEAVVTPEARVSFYYAFGVLPDAQLVLEKYYQNLVLHLELQPPVHREDMDLNPGLNIQITI